MAKLSVHDQNIHYLNRVKQALGLDSVTKALHVVILEHEKESLKKGLQSKDKSLE